MFRPRPIQTASQTLQQHHPITVSPIPSHQVSHSLLVSQIPLPISLHHLSHPPQLHGQRNISAFTCPELVEGSARRITPSYTMLSIPCLSARASTDSQSMSFEIFTSFDVPIPSLTSCSNTPLEDGTLDGINYITYIILAHVRSSRQTHAHFKDSFGHSIYICRYVLEPKRRQVVCALVSTLGELQCQRHP